MQYLAVVLHNYSDNMFWRHEEGDELAQAHQTYLDANDAEQACENVWILGNVDHAAQLPAELASHVEDVQTYRARGNRSLSVGDVVVLHPQSATGIAAEKTTGETTGETTAWAVASIGFTRLASIPAYTSDDPATPYSAACAALLTR